MRIVAYPNVSYERIRIQNDYFRSRKEKVRQLAFHSTKPHVCPFPTRLKKLSYFLAMHFNALKCLSKWKYALWALLPYQG